jgi:DNA repair protein SbcD/Mre11
MTSFCFLHAADIHLDSPLYGLSRYEGMPVDDIRSATRAAFDNLVQCAIDEAVDFVVIAGDLFDGDWRDMGTGLYFARAMGLLDKAGIPAFILAGNHDAASVISRSIPWPTNVRLFGSKKPETHHLSDLAVAVHGQSFATSAVTENLVLAYPPAEEHVFNIGVLHTALAGRQGHANYAPCSVDDLKAKLYEYWALGHVHAFEIVSNDPYVVFPGNLQGRNIRETGAKGAVIVTVTDREVVAVERVELDVIRWAYLEVSCENVLIADVIDLIRAELARLQGANASGPPLVVRVTLIGQTTDAGALHDRAASLRDEVRAIAAAVSPDLYIEKVKVNVRAPVADDAVLGEELGALIEGAAADPGLAKALQDDLERFMVAASTTLGDPEEGELRQSAALGDWGAILRTASAALVSRLTREA